jgi:hypothetical protein
MHPAARSEVVAVLARHGRVQRAGIAGAGLCRRADVVPLDGPAVPVGVAHGGPAFRVHRHALRARLRGRASLCSILRGPGLRDGNQTKGLRITGLAARRIAEHAIGILRARGEVVLTHVERRAAFGLTERDEVRLEHGRTGGAHGVGIAAGRRAEVVHSRRIHARDVSESRSAAATAASGYHRETLTGSRARLVSLHSSVGAWASWNGGSSTSHPRRGREQSADGTSRTLPRAEHASTLCRFRAARRNCHGSPPDRRLA